uniref:Uncharacterized protein n=1 Tax=Arundo donax TaxID=35708 RepID=A0A0A9CDN2_ARUDO
MIQLVTVLMQVSYSYNAIEKTKS